jgi:hypothetical protein
MNDDELRLAAQDALEALTGFAYYGRAPGWDKAIQRLEAALGRTHPSCAAAQAIAHYQAIEAMGKHEGR